MAGQVRRTARARRDLIEIWSYIAGESSPTIADAVIARIISAFDVLAATPKMCRERKDWRGKPRCFPVRSYAVLYEPLPGGNGILVWRVVHGARDLRRIIRPPSGDDL